MLLIFDLDDTLIYTHPVFVELTKQFLQQMAELGFDDENVYYTMDAFDCEAVEEADAYVPWAFPNALRRTYEFYCEKSYQLVDEEQAAYFEELGNSFRTAEYPLAEGAKWVLDELLEAGHRLVLLTQGGYEEQKYKVELHNLPNYFDEIIVVDKKSTAVYQNIMQRHGFGPKQTVIIGNSLKSEIRPALELGALPIWVQICQGWDFEHAELGEGSKAVLKAHSLPEILELLHKNNGGESENYDEQ